MLKQYFALLLTLLLARAGAQNNLILLTEKGDLFWLFINDQPVNDSAQSVVTAKKITDDSCTVKIAFADRGIKNFSGSVYLTVGGKTVTNREFTYSLVEEKGKKTLKSISVNEVLSDSFAKPQSPEAKIKGIFTSEAKKKMEQDRLAGNYPPPGNCVQVLSDTLLASGLKALRDEHIEINRIKDGKWFISNNCLNVKQLMQVMDVYGRSDSKIKIAEFAFDYLQDHRNFLDVVESVKYPADKEEIEKFYHKRIEK